MATWTEVKAFLYKNYDIDSDDGNVVSMTFTNGKTSQLVFVAEIGPFITFASPVGKVGEVPPGKVLEGATTFGAKIVGDFYVLQHVGLLSTLDGDEITVPLALLAETADELEISLNGADTF
jgi:hypothetical protein